MARVHARIKTAIWADPDFRVLHSSTQRLYHLILEQPELSMCGVLAVTLGRWAQMAPDTTPKGLKAALNQLVAAQFVFVDQTTEEAWVRSFSKHDINFDSPNVVVGMAKDWVGIQSNTIRQRFLKGLPEGLLERFPQPYFEKLPKPFLEGFLACVPAHLHPPTSNHHPPVDRKRSHQIPEDFKLTDEMRQWCIDHKVQSDPDRETEQFRDYWQANGKTKLDWVATWRNWMRNADLYAQSRGPRINPAPKPRPRTCAGCGKSLLGQPVFNSQRGPLCKECAA